MSTYKTDRLHVFARRVWLWLRIVGREHWADHRYGPILAWQTVAIVHPWKEKDCERH